MSIIKVSNLTFSYNGSSDNIFERVNLRLDSDWKLGLVGRNGKGKTTLLNLLMGKYEYSGTIESVVSFNYFPFAVKHGDAFVIDVVNEFIPDLEEWRLRKELLMLGISDDVFYRAFDSLSKGEQTKTLIALLFLRENTFLLIDEPTNHLDSIGRQILAQYLKKKSGYIIVSHDRVFLDNCVDHILSINRSSIELNKGNYSEFLLNKDRQDEFETNRNEKLKTEIERLNVAGRQATIWADRVESSKHSGKFSSGLKPDRGHIGAQSAKMMKRAKAIENRCLTQVEEKSKLLKNIERQDSLSIESSGFDKERLVSVKNLRVAYGDNIVINSLDFEILRGERIALVGKNGSGKTSVFKAILKQINDYSGAVSLAGNLKISYVCQDTSFLSGNLNEFCTVQNIQKTKLLTILAKLGFKKTQFDKLLQEYSEGQKKKLLIAKSLCEQANLYIWDEPMNYIDIISRKQIEDLILTAAPTMIFVEHDQYFCDSIATRKILL